MKLRLPLVLLLAALLSGCGPALIVGIEVVGGAAVIVGVGYAIHSVDPAPRGDQ